MKTIFFFFTLFLINTIQLASAAPAQSGKSIHTAVRQYIATKLPVNTDYKTQLSQIDDRLHLPLCQQSLQIFTRRNLIKPGRNSIGVKCNSTKKWTIYTSATVFIFKDIVTLSQPIRRGDIFTADNLQIEKRDISSFRSGFFNNPDHIINKQATRNLSMGAVINQSNITEPKLIKRGEKVTIKISSPNLEISVAGIALMDGIKKQNIRVKNVKTNKIILATVKQHGLVVVMF